MFQNKQTDALLRELADSNKRLELSGRDKEQLQAQLDQTNQRIEILENENIELRTELQNTQLALNEQKRKTVIVQGVRSDEYTASIIQDLVLAAQHQPVSIELERAVAAAVAWMEAN
jgi:hypothetical protein